jgi:hypothetical protein
MAPKMQPLYAGSFEFSHLHAPETMSVYFPELCTVNNASNFTDIRPKFHHAAHFFESKYPAVEPHASANPIVRVVNCRRLPGPSPSGMQLLGIPSEHQVFGARR